MSGFLAPALLGATGWSAGGRRPAPAMQRAEDSAVGFRVTTLQHVPKTEFPAAEGYRASLEPSLRLVTCAGRFHLNCGSHVDDVFVHAELAP